MAAGSLASPQVRAHSKDVRNSAFSWAPFLLIVDSGDSMAFAELTSRGLLSGLALKSRRF